MHLELSALYPLYSLDPRAIWKGQFALLLIVFTAAVVWLIRLKPGSHALRTLQVCGVAGIIGMAGLQFAVLIHYLLYPSYLNHAEANAAAVSWLGWEGYPLYPPLDKGDVYGVAYGPALYQVTGFFLWLFGPSIGTSKIPGLTAFALSQVLSFATLWRAGLGVGGALTMTGMQCLLQAGFTDQGYVSGVRSDALLFFVAQAAVFTATSEIQPVDGGDPRPACGYLYQSQDPWRSIYPAGLGVLRVSIAEHRGGSATDLRRRLRRRSCFGCLLYPR